MKDKNFWSKLAYMINCYFVWGKNYIRMFWWWTKKLFGVQLPTDAIPEGAYCYFPDLEKNKNRKGWDPYYIKPCPYFKTLGIELNGCGYLSIITDDSVFDDMCKMCNIKFDLYELNDEEKRNF